MGITTKKGDLGQTMLKHQPVQKSAATIELLGTLDETIAQLVICYNLTADTSFQAVISDLSLIAAVTAGYKDSFDSTLIRKLDEKTAQFHSINTFSYPYNDYNKSVINLTRTVARRLERVYWRYGCENLINEDIAAYLNRLSDYLYTFL
ncbi:MAG: ATP:cob(I)alamin adenosyltransferase [Erysipelotrichaceae bacterium]|nr:ATP:cob(I)alamin adenosyltransferase [Erysipelotrichaceae bacterium]